MTNKPRKWKTMKKQKVKAVLGWGFLLPDGRLFNEAYSSRAAAIDNQSYEKTERVVRVRISLIKGVSRGRQAH